MIFRCKYIFIILIVFILSPFAQAQTVKSLEDIYSQINIKIQNEKGKLDSLKQSLNLKLKKIDYEKSKNDKDESIIKDLMASTVITSNEVNEQQSRLDSLQSLKNNVQEKLSKRYSAIIDSLSELSNTKDYKREKEKLKAEILTYTEKKLKLSPDTGLLSFNPEKILRINLHETKDKSEKKIYEEYLKNALSEVQEKLKNVDDKSVEIKNIIKLKEKTKSFLAEAEMDNDITPQRITEKTALTNSEGGFGPGSNRVSDTKSIGTQIQFYSLLLNQLNYIQTQGSNFNVPSTVDTSKRIMSLEDYQKLLTELNTKLEEYKLILLHKLGRSK